ncbi:MAG TPA: HAD-IIB family hydrolase [Phycisphaerales bacterium]|nr:HAD-IIB family hydrolase [Phycisphaerales bacterium]HRQ74668.1 HAD-IIB family hydrolase [Phycisphaerales bacterium]
MNARYDMLVIDLDGTLLDRDGYVSTANRRALDAARSGGLEVIIATGRAWVESMTALRAIAHDGLLIAAGGSLLCDAATGHTVDRHVMPRDLVADVTSALLGHGHKVLILKDAHAAGYDYLAVGPGRLDPASEWWFNTIPAKVRHVDGLHEDEHPDETVRAGVVASSAELTPIARDLQVALGGRAFLQHWAAVTESEATGSSTHLLEVFNPNVSKWTMIESICQQRGIDRDRVAAIGDGLNDVEMIANAGLGVAMANADHRVMQAADRVTARHDEDGVAAAIDRILTGEW